MSKPTVLVTGSAGHLGKALMLALPDLGYSPIGIDINPSPTTTHTGSITDAAFVGSIFATHKPVHVIHAATLHKPHIISHTKNDFIQTNIAGTLTLLEAATEAGAQSFVFISTTSAFGSALSPPPGEPAAWIDESVRPEPKNIYGVTKTAAEDVCRLVAASKSQSGPPVVVLRTSRFFPEEDDDEDRRGAFAEGDNLKVLELAYRRVDIADVVSACVCAMEKVAARQIGPWAGVYIVSAPTPFSRNAETLAELDRDSEAVFERARPGVREVFARKGWKFLARVDRVYDSARAVAQLGWRPVYTFERAIEKVARGEEWRSELALKVGKLGYHAVPTGVYTTTERVQASE